MRQRMPPLRKQGAMKDDNDDLAARNGEHGDQEKPILQTTVAERARRTTPLNIPATDWVHSLPVLRATGKMLLLVIARHSDA